MRSTSHLAALEAIVLPTRLIQLKRTETHLRVRFRSSLQIGTQDFDKFLGTLRLPRIPLMCRIDDVITDVVLN